MTMEIQKRLFAVVLVFLAFTTFAQSGGDSLRVKEPERVEFLPHWYMQLQGGAAYTLGEASFGDLLSPAASVSAGYKFSPLWNIRLNVSGWQAKGATVYPKNDYKYNFIQGALDFGADLGTLFCGYNHKRFFNPYLFVGVGMNYAFGNDDAIALKNQGFVFEKLWNDNKVSLLGRGGLGADFRVSDRVALNLEVAANMLNDAFNSKKGSTFDWHFTGLIGVSIKLGKSHKVIPPVYYEPEPVVVEEPKPEPVKIQEPKPAPAPVVTEKVEKVEPVKECVFFLINSSKVRKSEMGKIERLVEYMMKYPNSKVDVCGYADKGTGTASVNNRISKRRAESVAAALKAKGIDDTRINISFKGDTEQPFERNSENRVSICIAE